MAVDEQREDLDAGRAPGLPRLSVGALATDPSDGSVWVGTGEANNASENQYGVGVFRLAQGSSTWQQVGGAELNGAGSYRIVWINGYVYVATSHGLYRRSGRARPELAVDAGAGAGRACRTIRRARR